jgi:signal transduction histidine kinase
MNVWVLGATGNLVISAAYLAIAGHIFYGMARANQWRNNPLALATGAIFFTCGVGHGLHLVHLMLPSFGVEAGLGNAAREEFSDWHIWSWDWLTAGIAVWYWGLRNRFPALVRGTALFEDIRVRQRQALEIHDNVVQGLAVAKLSLDMGKMVEASNAVEGALAASRKIISDLLGEPDSKFALRPGDLRRQSPAGELS